MTASSNYQMGDPDASQRTQYDFERGVCAYTTYRMLATQDLELIPERKQGRFKV